MEETKIQFETAKLAKEAGFDEPCKWHYTQNKPEKVPQLFSVYPIQAVNSWTGRFSAPNQSLLQKWLRDSHNIHIEIGIVVRDHQTTNFTYYIYKTNDWYMVDRSNISELELSTYEESLESALIESLNLII